MMFIFATWDFFRSFLNILPCFDARIYHSENSYSVQYYDCIFGKDVDNLLIRYCSDQHISISDVLQGSSTIEQTDRYGKYLSNHSFNIKHAIVLIQVPSANFVNIVTMMTISTITKLSHEI